MSEERAHMLACNWRLQRLFAFELRRWEAIEAERAECAWASSILHPRAKLGRADEADIAGRAAKCAATGAFPKSTTPLAPAKPLTLKDVRGKRPAEDAEQRPTRKPRAERTSDVTQIIRAGPMPRPIL